MDSFIYTLIKKIFKRCSSLQMFILLLLPCMILLLIAIKRYMFIRKLSWIPEPPGLPILGNSLSLTGGQVEFFKLLMKYSANYGSIFKLWIGMRPFIFISRVEYIQPILSSSLHIDKSYEYKFLNSWLGTGLLTSTGSKWHERRKLLTPTFHYLILQDFIDPIIVQSQILVECLSKEMNKAPFNVLPYTKLYALDVICVTSMGKCLNIQLNKNHEYVQAIDRVNEILQRRFITPWLKPEFIFNKSFMGKQQRKYVEKIHEFVNNIIKEKKSTMSNQNFRNSESSTLNRKNRPFLELILEAAENGEMLSDADIRDEVNTFMFAGHDTISVALSWCLYVLGKYPDVQEKILEEYEITVKDVIPKYSELQQLPYLESCIKEVMRLYPAVPLIARDIKYNVPISNDKIIHPGATTLIFIPALHRNPEYFSSPHEFKPERFLHRGRESDNPFCYIPFSAGPRNCIGSKFAMIELKIALHSVLKSYIVSSAGSDEDLKLYSEIVLQNKGGIKIQLQNRKL